MPDSPRTAGEGYQNGPPVLFVSTLGKISFGDREESVLRVGSIVLMCRWGWVGLGAPVVILVLKGGTWAKYPEIGNYAKATVSILRKIKKITNFWLLGS